MFGKEPYCNLHGISKFGCSFGFLLFENYRTPSVRRGRLSLTINCYFVAMATDGFSSLAVCSDHCLRPIDTSMMH
jgi:hypothetical protein